MTDTCDGPVICHLSYATVPSHSIKHCFLCVCLFVFGGALQYVGSWFPNQGLNPHPPHWKRSLNHWTAREVHRTCLDVAVKVCFPGGISVKEPPGNAGDAGETGLIPESGRSPGGGHGNPFQYFCL